MLSFSNLLKKSLENFPKWMDIRKRYKKSNGGIIISNIAEEIETINDDLKEYIDMHFISNYEDKCESIIDYVYTISIGFCEPSDVIMIEPKLKVTDDIKLFNDNSEEYAFIENGMLSITIPLNKIEYRINNKEFISNTEKNNIWNIYDEFALILNINRYKDETNRELFNRIKKTSQKVINSSKDGLKNAIISSVINYIPEIKEDNIVIEPIGENNLHVKNTSTNESAIDELSSINKDILNKKSWDIDRWQNLNKNITYAPHEWDTKITSFVNGIGDNDDLKAILIDGKTTTDAKISIYEESEEKLTKYVKNNKLMDQLNIPLYKYKDSLKQIEPLYMIKATEAMKVATDLDSINFELYKSSIGKHSRNVEEVIIEDYSKNIYTSNSAELYENINYKFKILPVDEYTPIEISTMSLLKSNGEVVNLMSDYDNEKFCMINDKLVSRKTKKNITKLYQYYSHENLIQNENGIFTDNIGEQSSVSLEINNCENQRMKLIFDTESTYVEDINIIKNGFYYDNTKRIYVSDTTEELEKNIIIDERSNNLSFTIEGGQAIVTVIVDGELLMNKQISSEEKYFTTPTYNSMKRISLTISSLGKSTTILKDIRMKKYDLQLRTTKSKLEKIYDEDEENIYILPNESINSLYVTFRTYTQYPIYLKKIYIGEKYNSSSDYFLTSNIKIQESKAKISIKTNSNITRYFSLNEIISLENESVNIEPNFICFNEYMAYSNDSYIIIDLKDYNEIKKIIPLKGSYESIGNYEENLYMIRLRNGQSISTIEIDGIYHALYKTQTLKEVLLNKGINLGIEEDIYCTLLSKELIIHNNLSNEQSKIQITNKDFNVDINEISSLKINNLNSSIQSCFITSPDDNNDKYNIISNKIDGYFDTIQFYPKNSKEYIAYNKTSLVTKEKNDIDIINTFNNGYIDDMIAYYEVLSLNENVDIIFKNNKTWSLFKEKLNAKITKSYDGDNFNVTNKVLSINKKIEKSIPLEQINSINENEYVDISEYIIPDSDIYEVQYDTNLKEDEYIKEEIFYLYNKEFVKLKYSNIVSIINIREVGSKDDDNQNIDQSLYSILGDGKEGIILLDPNAFKLYDKIKIKYQIKKPISLLMSNDYIYQKINYSIKAFNMKNSFNIKDISTGNVINLNTSSILDETGKISLSKAFEEGNVVYVECSNPNFNCIKENSSIIFNKIYNENMIAAKNGWYYLYGKEYYMYATDEYYKIIQDEDIEFYEVNKNDYELITHKKTANFIKNSKMAINAISNIYSADDFDKIEDVRGVSSMNSLTACDTYNHWETFAGDVFIQKGLNGYGLEIIPSINKSYAYAILDITQFLFKKNYISLYNPNNFEIYLGKSHNSNYASILKEVRYVNELERFVLAYENIYCKSFEYNNLYNYYIVISSKERGVVDDIVIQDGNNPATNVHKKNIDILNLKIEEQVPTNSIVRLLVNNEYGNKSISTEINNEGYIINNATVDWNFTKIKSYSAERDWLENFELENVDVTKINDIDCAVTTSFSAGKIKTRPIYIGNPKTISKILYKINNINTPEMNGFTCSLYQSKSATTGYIPCILEYDSRLCVNYSDDISYEYVQLEIAMQSNKVINNLEIYIEHKSNSLDAPTEEINNQGEFISKVLNTYSVNDYVLKTVGITDHYGTFEMFIRAAKESSSVDVWTDWKNIILDENYKVINNIRFNEYKYFQIKIKIYGKDTKIKIQHIELEVAI